MMIIREATLSDAEGIAKVHVDSWRTTYKGIVSDVFLEQLSYKKELNPGSKIYNDWIIM
ncbi:hypothetical protein [Robertmurraya siralis]|nr:hypothetical protein [Robertmurraya siralis]